MPSEKIGVVLANLGTPDAPEPRALHSYLKQFLSDPRVIDWPKIPWQILLRTLVLPIRTRRVAKLYRKIWTPQGSPLMVISRQQQAALQAQLDQNGVSAQVELAMAYGNPSVPSALKSLLEQQVSRIIVLPLFPQYSSATTGAALDAVAAALRTCKGFPPFELIYSYHDHPLYIKALADTIELEADEHLLFSYHGLPARFEKEGDYYPSHCQETARLVTEQLGLGQEQWSLAYQSRFGPEEWLKPYTDEVLQAFPQQGRQKVAVICPGFSADCLETLEEIEEENRRYFTAAGGQQFRYIPALNASPAHIRLMAELVQSRL